MVILGASWIIPMTAKSTLTNLFLFFFLFLFICPGLQRKCVEKLQLSMVDQVPSYEDVGLKLTFSQMEMEEKEGEEEGKRKVNSLFDIFYGLAKSRYKQSPKL